MYSNFNKITRLLSSQVWFCAARVIFAISSSRHLSENHKHRSKCSFSSFHFDELRLKLGDRSGLLRPLVVVCPVALAEVDVLERRAGLAVLVRLPAAGNPPGER